MNTPLRRPRALITGGSKGIGLHLATIAAERGHDPILVARDAAELASAAETIEASTGAQVTWHAVDLADRSAVTELADALTRAARDESPLDLLVNNAGFGAVADTADLELQTQLDMTAVNCEAVVHLTARLLPSMIERGHGAVMNVASVAAFQPGPGAALYYASKAFVLHWTEALHTELEGTGVRATALCPGPTVTEFQERAGAGVPAGIPAQDRHLTLSARAVADAGFAALDRNRAVVIPGVTNAALTQVPRLLPRRLVPALVRATTQKIRRD